MVGFLNVPEFWFFVFGQHYDHDDNDGKGDKERHDGSDPHAVHPRRRHSVRLWTGARVHVSGTLGFDHLKGFGVGVHAFAEPGVYCVVGVDGPLERVVAVFGLYGCGKGFPVLRARVAGNKARESVYVGFKGLLFFSRRGLAGVSAQHLMQRGPLHRAPT